MIKRTDSLRFRITRAYVLASAISLALIFAALDIHLSRMAVRQADRFLTAEAQQLAHLSARRKDRILQAEFDRAARFHGERRVFLRLMANDGTVLARSSPTYWNHSAMLDFRPKIRSPRVSVSRTFTGQGRTIRSVYVVDTGGRILQVACDLDPFEEAAWVYRGILLGGLLISLLAGVFVTWKIAGGTVARIDRLRRTAGDIAGGDLSGRASLDGPRDEIADLSAAFNAMVTRIESLVTELRNMSDNVAHDLRTPITRIRGHAEVLLSAPRSSEEVRDSAGVVVEECDRLARTIDAMLQIARMEAGMFPGSVADVDIVALARDALELFEPVAQDAGVRLSGEGSADRIVVRGSASALQRVIANLLDNAIKFTPAGGSVRILWASESGSATLRIEDSGAGIPPEDLPHVFERFYRSKQARSQTGSGLGLSLTRAIVRAHGGTIRADSAPGMGTSVHVCLPCPGPL